MVMRLQDAQRMLGDRGQEQDLRLFESDEAPVRSAVPGPSEKRARKAAFADDVADVADDDDDQDEDASEEGDDDDLQEGGLAARTRFAADESDDEEATGKDIAYADSDCTE